MTAGDALVVLLDGQPRSIPPGSTLADLVTSLGHPPNGVATAVNRLFVPRAERAAYTLQRDDAVLLMKPIVGG